MTAPPGPPPPAQPPPRQLALLKQLATSRLEGIKPETFLIKNWLSAAKDAFAAADAKSIQAHQHPNICQLAEDAYIEYRKAAHVISKISAHPDYPRLKTQHPSDYFAYQALKPVSHRATQSGLAKLEPSEADKRVTDCRAARARVDA